MADENTNSSNTDTNKAADDAARKEADELRAKVSELTGTVEKLTKAAKSDAKDKASASELKAAMEALEATNEQLTKRVEAHEKSLDARADKLLAKLSDDSKKRIEKYKGKLSKADWLEMVEETVEAIGSSSASDEDEGEGEVDKNKSSVTATPNNGARKPGSKRELQPMTRKVLMDLGYDPDNMIGRPSQVSHDVHYGNARFQESTMEMIKKLKRREGNAWTRENAEKRKGA